MKKNILIVILAIISLNEVFATGEWKNSLSFFSVYDENPFHFNASEKLNINNSSYNLNYKNIENGFSANYTLGYSLIPQLSISDLSDNIFNLKYSKDLDEEENFELNLAGQYANKNNSGDLSLYNYNMILASIGLNKNLNESVQFNVGIDGAYKSYSNNKDFSFLESIYYVGVKSYFETNTSIMAELNYGNKLFISNLFSMGGKGNRNSSTTTSNSSINMISGSIKIAQSIAKLTGLSIQYYHSLNLSSSLANEISVNPDKIFEKDIYDDNYSYSSKELSISLTQQFRNNIKLQFMGFYSNKNYIYEYDFSNETTVENRIDNNSGISINLEKGFKDFLFFTGGKISLNYQYTINNSNSELFRYKSNYFASGLKLTF